MYSLHPQRVLTVIQFFATIYPQKVKSNVVIIQDTV